MPVPTLSRAVTLEQGPCRQSERKREGYTHHPPTHPKQTLKPHTPYTPGESFSRVKGAEEVTGPASSFTCTVSSDFSPTFFPHFFRGGKNGRRDIQ